MLPTQPRAQLLARRIIAYVVDIVILFLILAPTGYLIQALLGLPLAQSGPALGRTILWNFSLPVWLYFIISDQSLAGATLGKRLLKIGVKRVNGARVGLGRAIGRTAVKLLPWELVHLIAFTLSTDLSQFTGLQTIGLTLTNLLVVGYLVVAFLTRGRQSVHDLVMGTVVQT